MTVHNIESRWLRRTVLIITIIPICVCGAVFYGALAAFETIGEACDSAIEVWRKT